ncbi:WH2 domain-containing protein [Balamuthia mandrillaris]
MSGPPPPPAGPPPPPPANIVKLPSGASTAGRGALLQDIEGFRKGKLKKAVTVDKSGPAISNNKNAPGGGGGGGGGSVGSGVTGGSGGGASSSGPAGMMGGGFNPFAGGMPKLRKATNQPAAPSSSAQPVRPPPSNTNTAPFVPQLRKTEPNNSSSNNIAPRRPPPAIPAATPPATMCRAKWGYAPTRPDELELQKGAVYTVLEQKGQWWKGQSQDGTVGMFPSNYVTLLSPEEAKQYQPKAVKSLSRPSPSPPSPSVPPSTSASTAFTAAKNNTATSSPPKRTPPPLPVTSSVSPPSPSPSSLSSSPPAKRALPFSVTSSASSPSPSPPSNVTNRRPEPQPRRKDPLPSASSSVTFRNNEANEDRKEQREQGSATSTEGNKLFDKVTNFGESLYKDFRSWNEFLGVSPSSDASSSPSSSSSAFKVPEDVLVAQDRVQRNMVYFKSNYSVLFAVCLLLMSFVFHMELFQVLLTAVVGAGIIFALRNTPLHVGTVELSQLHRSALLLLAIIVLVFFLELTKPLLYLSLSSFSVCIIHAAMKIVPSPEASSADLLKQH